MAERNTIIELPPPHSVGQAEMVEWPGNGVAYCGRRWGKSVAGVYRILRSASIMPGMYWWCGLSWNSASMKTAWDLLMKYSSEAIRASKLSPSKMINRTNHEIRLPNGSTIWARTAERPESLAGAGIRGVVIDEFTLMPESVWTEYLQGTLLDYGGWALFVGVPKGENWASQLWRRASNGEMGANWKAWHFSSYENPFISASDLDEVRRTAPDMIFRQEYLAEIIDEVGTVFRGVRVAADAVAQEIAQSGHIYTIGVDFARLHDFTVYAVMDVTTSEIVAIDRFNKVEYELQVQRFLALYRRFRPAIIVAEENSMGGPVVERLTELLRQIKGPSIIPFQTTNSSKDALIRSWAVAIESKEVHLPADEIVISEHQAYTMRQTAAGNWTYSAPDGMYDDTVIACALSYYGTTGRKALSFDWNPVSMTQTNVWNR